MKNSKNKPFISFRRALLFFGFLFTSKLVFSLLVHDQDFVELFDGLFRLFEGLGTLIGLFFISRYIAQNNKKFLRAWVFLTLGMLSTFLGDIVWGALVLYFHEPPTPSLVDLFYVFFYIFTWIGLNSYPVAQTKDRENKYVWLDNIIVLLGSGLIFWVLLIGPLVQANWGDFSQLTVSMLYPTLDLLLLWFLLTFFRSRPEQSNYTPLLLIGLGIFVALTADSLFTYQDLAGIYTEGNITDVLWEMGYFIILLAGLSQAHAITIPSNHPQSPEINKSSKQTWPVYLPYVWLIIAGMVLFTNGTSPTQEPGTYVTIGIIVSLVVLRQVMTLHDNETLLTKVEIELNERILAQNALRYAHNDLEKRVTQRTLELKTANEELKIQITDRESAQQALRRRAEMDHLVALISSLFVNASAGEIDEEINNTLAKLGSFAGAERCYLAQYYHDGNSFSTTYEWTAPGVVPHIQIVQNIQSSSTPWWTENLRSLKIIHIPDVNRMPPEAEIEMKIFQRQNIQSLVVVPLVSEHNLVGFLGFDTLIGRNEYLADEIILLKTIAEILTNALRRTGLQLELKDHIAQIEKSLDEKNVLLKEIHHRVKNNLQIISSLLNLQSAQIKDIQTVQIFRDSQNRVRSMALIHEKLYQSPDLARIDFKAYVESLSSYLVRSFASEARGVRFVLNIENVNLEIDQAIPCGLIINELVSNTLKYAFPNERLGEVHVEFNMDENQECHLIVGDDGVGFPKNFDFQKSSSLGLQLVNSLVIQLGGEIELITTSGSEFRITFHEPVKV